MTRNIKIAVLLPPREMFRQERAGAVALCVADFTRFSCYKQKISIFGGTESNFGEIPYERVTGQKRWYWSKSYTYAVNFSMIARHRGFTHVEVHNRPLILKYLNKLLPSDIATSLHLHNDPQGMKGIRRPSERQKLLDNSAAIYCVSDYIRTRFIEGLSHGLEKVHVIHNGIDTHQYSGDAKEKIILYVGRIIQEKGVLPLAKAFGIVASELPGWRFVICGHDRPGIISEYEKLTHAELEKLGDRCVYTGFVSHEEVMKFFSEAEISVVPSVWEEPFGRTALEAMACSAAVITSGSGGLKEIVGDAGVTVQPLTPELLARAIIDMGRDEVKRKIYGAQAADRARLLFDIRGVTATLDRIRGSLLGRP